MTREFNEVAQINDWSEVYQLAQTYRQQQQWQSAAIALQRTIELKSDFFWSYHHLGDTLSQLQQWQGAVKAYRQAVQLDPEFFWSWHNLGDALSRLQQWQGAVKAYRQAVQLDPEFFWSWHNLGDALSRLQQWQIAVKAYLQGIYLQPDHQLSSQKLGRSFKEQGDLVTTIQHYRQVIKAPPVNSIFERYQTQPQRLVKLIKTLSQEHQIWGAVIVCYMALEIQPTNSAILLQLASLLAKQEKLELAIAQNQQKLDHNTASSLLNQLATATLQNTLQKQPLKPISGRVVIQGNSSVTAKQLNELCVAVGWSSRPLAKLQQAIEHSFICITAWHTDQEQKRLIGFVRVVADGVYQATLLDVAVHPDFQGRGIGRNIVQTAIKQLNAA
ncbi:MAG: GNAT family N-acetyltransferase, partial [Cyanobacteria bacterium J06643_13]